MSPSICGCRLTAFLLTALMTLTPVLAFEVGDRVTFSRAGSSGEGVVSDVRGGGKFLVIEVDNGGRKSKVVVLASQAKASASAPAADDSMRMWTDASGSFSVKATLVEQSATMATLRKEDGRVINVPIEKLSIGDQEYLALMDTADPNPFAGGTSMPATGSSFAPSSNGGASPSRSFGGVAQLSVPQAVKLPEGKKLLLTNMSPPASIQADTTPYDFSALGNAALNVTKKEFREDMTRPFIVGSDGSTLACCLKSSWSNNDKFTKVFHIDGRRGSAQQVAECTGRSFGIASADPGTGDALIIFDAAQGTQSSGLGIMTGLTDGSPRIAMTWDMFPGDSNKKDYVRYRRVLPGGIAVVVYGQTIRVINYRNRSTVWTCAQTMFNEPAVSAGGRYTAVADTTGEQIAIVETATGQQIGSVPCGKIGSVSMGFSPDAKRIALSEGNKVRVFEVATGEVLLEHEANVPLSKHGGQLPWYGQSFLLLPTGPVLSLKRNLIVWNYQMQGEPIEYADRIFEGLYPVVNDGSVGIVRLPHEKAIEAADREVGDLAAVSQGDSIAVNVTGSGPGATTNQIRSWIEAAIEKAGYRVASDAPTKLNASVTRGKTEERSYREFGNFGTTEVKFTPYISKVDVVQGSDTLWTRSSRSSMPFFVRGDKTLKQIARENEKPNTGVFENMELPEQILKLEYQKGFGNSMVSIQGIRDM
ncbi:SHD1 domain-containing protein [Crateriforma conspicua]|uniref:SLA1 homology domain-containing protein n=1 Tax=Crateriforma conspicua TaxID=2527996 RepID=A0A5C5Y4H1_9PLAN|nr:SHD1 domain-containing protein [Crateriforma conspicua]TWT68272.1 hypothetical protein Pan14r_05160 [Crateriforma conspicua]